MKNVRYKEHVAVNKEIFVLQFKLKLVEHKCHTESNIDTALAQNTLTTQKFLQGFEDFI